MNVNMAVVEKGGPLPSLIFFFFFLKSIFFVFFAWTACPVP